MKELKDNPSIVELRQSNKIIQMIPPQDGHRPLGEG